MYGSPAVYIQSAVLMKLHNGHCRKGLGDRAGGPHGVGGSQAPPLAVRIAVSGYPWYVGGLYNG